MSSFPSLPLFTDAFLADTGHLSAQETGAYLLLLMMAWRLPECRLPDNDTNSILDRGYDKPRQLDREPLPKVAPAESYADAMAKIDAEFNELLEESLLKFSAKEESPQRDRRPAEPDPSLSRP